MFLKFRLNWRLPLIQAFSNGTSWNVTDTLTGVSRSGKSEFAANYANGTLLAMQNEVVAFMQAILSSAAYFGSAFGGASPNLGSPITLGPYSRTLDNQLVGLTQLPNGTAVTDSSASSACPLNGFFFGSNGTNLCVLKFAFACSASTGTFLPGSCAPSAETTVSGASVALGGVFNTSSISNSSVPSLSYLQLTSLGGASGNTTFDASALLFNATAGNTFTIIGSQQYGLVGGKITSISISFGRRALIVGPGPDAQPSCGTANAVCRARDSNW
jgi:hypothetical protein